MILQKDLLNEALGKGLKQSAFRRRVVEPLISAGEISPVHNKKRHNRVEYSEDDAAKIRAKVEEVLEEDARLAAEEAESKHSEEPTSLHELATTPGPERPKPAPKPKEKKASAPAEKKGGSGWKEKLTDKKTLLIIGGAVLLVAALWWFKRRREEEPAVVPDMPPEPISPLDMMEQKWKETFGT